MDELRNEMDDCFETLHRLINESFVMMDDQKELRDEVVELWKQHILRFVNHTYKTGEKFNNKEVFKSITKALMFGR